MKRYLFFILILLLFGSLTGMEISRCNSFELISGIDYSLLHFYAYEYTIYQLSLQLSEHVAGLIAELPKSDRQHLPVTKQEILYLIPLLFNQEDFSETIKDERLIIKADISLRDSNDIKYLLSLSPREISGLLDYYKSLFSNLILINTSLISYVADETKDYLLADLEFYLREIKANHYMFLGDKDYSIKDFEQAVAHYDSALAINPAQGQIFHKLYDTFQLLDDTEKAVLTLKTWLETIPGDQDALLLKGKYLEEKGETEKAVSLYEKLLELDKRYPEAAFFLARYYEQIGQSKKVSSYAKIAADNQKEYAETDRELALLLIDQNLLPEVVPVLKRLLLHYPRDHQLFQMLGDVCFKQHSYWEAVYFYRGSINLNPDNPRALLNLADCFYQLNEYDEAINIYRKVIDSDPDNDLTYFRIGNALFRSERYEEAIAYYRKALQSSFIYPEVFFNLGNASFRLENYEDAVHYYQLALEIQPGYPNALFNLAASYHELQNWETALIYYQKVLELEPGYSRVYFNIGNYHKNLGDFEVAIENYLLALAIDRDDPYTYSNKADCYRMLGNYEEAKKAYLKAIELKPDNPIPYNNLSLTYYLTEEYELSLEYLKKAAELGHENAGNILGEIK
jgi:tetratricopeptide (TPR) repeat protein